MTFTDPIDFDEAVRKLDEKGLLPTELSTAELRAHVSGELRDRSFFSARVLNARLLQAFKNAVARIVRGESNAATQRAELKLLLASIDYRPEADQEGTLRDLSSNARLDLILRTNVATVRGFGQWQQGNRPGALEAFPALELLRISDRKVPREWAERWADALEDCGREDGATDGADRMVALKNHPIWSSLGEGAGGYDDALGNPFPPFAFNSGMGVEDVDYEDACDLGVMDPEDDPLPPDARSMNQGLEVSTSDLDADFADVLAEGLGGMVRLVEGALVFKNDAQDMRDRGALVLSFLDNAGNPDEPRDDHGRWARIGGRKLQSDRGLKAIKTALQTRRDAVSAMVHPDVGAIDFPIDKRGGKGLDAIVEKHGLAAALNAPRVIAYGEAAAPTGNTQAFEHEGCRVVLTRSDDRDRRHWLLTSYERTGQKKAPLANSGKDSIPSSLRAAGLHWPRPAVGAVAAFHDGPSAAVRQLRDRGEALLQFLGEAACT